jgi:hypothetical protein
MNAKHDDDLCTRYPAIFANRNASVMESAMGFGFECGDGWFELVDMLCARLQHHTDHAGGPQVVAAQVKEKFGTLRFYVDGADDVQEGLIAQAEALSERTCEYCGVLDRAPSRAECLLKHSAADRTESASGKETA